MPSIYDVRRQNLRALIREWRGPTSLARKLGHSNGSYLAQLIGPNPSREISEKVARGIEAKLNLPLGWLDRETPERPPIDDSVLAHCVRAVAAAVQDSPVKVSPEKFAELVTLAYEHHAATGTCDEGYINRLMRLLK